MPYRLLADLVLVAHLGFILFVLFGGLLVLRWPRVIWLHLAAVAWGASIEFIGFPCPLTIVENALRERGGKAVYGGDFIDHLVTALVYPQGLTRGIQLMLGVIVLALNALVYARLIYRSRATAKSSR